VLESKLEAAIFVVVVVVVFNQENPATYTFKRIKM
jgi:hypothetical protein